MSEQIKHYVSPSSAEVTNYSSAEFIISSIILTLLVIVVIIGNCFVVAAVMTSPKLRSITNLFITSLATADLLLGILVLPTSGIYEVLNYWIFGDLWCRVWLAVDVWVCTASILNLCAISFDRWLAIAYPVKYLSLMSSKRGKMLIGLAWLVSFIVCFPPLIGWNEKGTLVVPETPNLLLQETAVEQHFGIIYVNSTSSYMEFIKWDIDASSQNMSNMTRAQCHLTSEPGYIVYSAVGSFFLPCFVMVFFYYKIYKAATKFTRSLRRGVITAKRSSVLSPNEQHVTMRVHRGGGNSSCRNSLILERPPSTSSYNIDLERKSSENDGSSPRPARRHSIFAFQKQSSRNLRQSNRADSLEMLQMDLKKRMNSKCLPLPTRPVSLSSHHKQPSKTKLFIRDERVTKKKPRYPKTERNAKMEEKNATNNNHSVEHNKPISPKRIVFSFKSKLSWKKSDRSAVGRHNRETKAAKTVAIIVGCFCICWAPFFTVYLSGAFCKDCTPEIVFKIMFWLGYCNSALNPFIYALFSRDFRHAFQKLLRCKAKFRNKTCRRDVVAHYGGSIRVKTNSNHSNSADHEIMV